MNIYINASNIYIGGGKVILNDLVNCTKYYRNHNFVIYVDPRFKIKDFGRSNIMFKKIEKHVRFLVCFEIERKVKVNDIVIYLTNIPPIIKHKCTTVLVQSNRLVVDWFSLSGFSSNTMSLGVGSEDADSSVICSFSRGISSCWAWDTSICCNSANAGR